MKNYIPDYPRPQLIRTDWENLNGAWDFAFDDIVNATKFTKEGSIILRLEQNEEVKIALSHLGE